jgi:hypothetical protein
MKSCLYETDYYQWSLDQADHLKNRRFDMLDYDYLIEQIESLGRSEQRALKNHLINLLKHMIKAKYQPEKQTRSWDLSIKNAKKEVKSIIKQNPSFTRFIPEYYLDAYEFAKIEAEKETGLDIDNFQEECPWSIDEILNEVKK